MPPSACRQHDRLVDAAASVPSAFPCAVSALCLVDFVGDAKLEEVGRKRPMNSMVRSGDLRRQLPKGL